MRSISVVMVLALAVGFARADEDTGTPYPAGTRVAVMMPSGTKHGVLKPNKTAGWILLLEDGEKDAVAIKVDSGVSIKPSSIDKDKTIKYWQDLMAITGTLSKADEDRGFWTRTGKAGKHDFQPMSDQKLRRFASQIGDLKKEGVDQKAIDLATSVKVWVETVADSRDPKVLLAAAGEGSQYNFTPTLERTQASIRKMREAREACYKKIADSLEYLQKNYGDACQPLVLPSKEEK